MPDQKLIVETTRRHEIYRPSRIEPGEVRDIRRHAHRGVGPTLSVAALGRVLGVEPGTPLRWEKYGADGPAALALALLDEYGVAHFEHRAAPHVLAAVMTSQKITWIRERAGLTREGLAVVLGSSRQTVLRWEVANQRGVIRTPAPIVRTLLWRISVDGLSSVLIPGPS